MRVLVTWGSKRGGTRGIGHILAEALRERGFEVESAPVERAGRLDDFGAVIVGGALYANRWVASARRFVRRHVKELRRVPVWLFSSGPLDHSADQGDLPAPPQIGVLAERVGALGHVTFGGRLESDARGFPASAMARTASGDWRNPERIREWAAELATAIPAARPGVPVEHPARSASRLLGYALAGWALCSAIMGALLGLTSVGLALALHALAAPLVFAGLGWLYFRARGARDPLPTAATWTTAVALLDLLVVAGATQGSLEMFESFAGTWLPFALIFIATWVTGAVMSMVPSPEQRSAGSH